VEEFVELGVRYHPAETVKGALFGDLAPGYYLTFCAIVSLSALVTIRRTSADDGFA